MIGVLRIAGFALIDEVEVEFGPGFNVITGETGAGKSILVEALSILRGARASSDVIRAGLDEARVEAEIEVPAASHVRARLDAEGRDASEGLLVRRTVARSGRGRIHLGGALASAADLGATVGRLIDISSQHGSQSLTDPEAQMAIVDAFAGVAEELGEMAEAHAALGAAEASLAAFDADARTRSAREDLLRFQLAELEGAALAPGEEERLRGERERLRHAGRFLEGAIRGEEALESGEHGAHSAIAATARSLETLAALDPALTPIAERLREAQEGVAWAAAELSRYAAAVRADPGRLEEVEERLFLISRLCRKHGTDNAGLLARRDELVAELAEMGSFEEGVAARRRACEEAHARAAAAASALTAARRRAAIALGAKIGAHLGELGLGTARIEVLVEPKDMGPRGANRVVFLFAPNPGEEPRPLARIASGGELSRVMLAVKQALARTDEVLTYVFDEVDAGIGGATADAVGRKLKRIAAERQIVTITHLPQIAAFADRHYRVEKKVRKGRTEVVVELVEGARRTRELARMLGGAAPSAQALAHAEEMLERGAESAS